MEFFTNPEDNRLNVIDIHPAWCGGVGIMG